MFSVQDTFVHETVALNSVYSPFLCQVSGPQWVRKCAMFVRAMSLADVSGKWWCAAKLASCRGWDQFWNHLLLCTRSSDTDVRTWTHPCSSVDVHAVVFLCVFCHVFVCMVFVVAAHILPFCVMFVPTWLCVNMVEVVIFRESSHIFGRQLRWQKIFALWQHSLSSV